MKRKIWAAALIAGLLAARTAEAREIRLPESGVPAMVVQVPDDWMNRPDGSNLLVGAADHSASLAFSLAEYEGDLEHAAQAIMKEVGAVGISKLGPASIGAFTGSAYFSTIANKSGANVTVHLVIVRVDAKHIAAATLVETLSATMEQRQAAQQVLDNTRVVQ
jgi:hypothetical protein